MKKPFLRWNNPVWAFLCSILFLLVFSWSTSPLYMLFGGDSPWYQIIGLGITQGKVPYVDLFDHKGPLVFFADALGFSLGCGKLGIFFLQVAFMTVTFTFIYKTAALFASTPKRAAAAFALTLIPLVDFIIEGNQCEEWMLPWTSVSLYLICRYILSGEEKHSPWMSLFYGLSFGVLFYIRPNDGVMWVASLFLGLFILWLVRKQYRQILPNVGAFLGGALTVSAFVFGYFLKHNAVGDFLYGMIFLNLHYAGDAFFTWGGSGMIIIPAIIIVAILIMAKRDGRKDFRYIFIPMLVLVIALIGKRDFYHYLIPFVPTIAVCFAMCLEHRWKAFLWIVCVLFAVFSFREFKCITKGLLNKARYTEFYEQTDALLDNVPEAERNNIWNYNLTNYIEDETGPHLASLMGVFVHKNITPGNAVFAYFQLSYMDPERAWRLGIVANEPEWVLMQPDDVCNAEFDYIYENYDLVAATPAKPVCEVRLYRRKADR